ncbi:hypothetical protein MOE03_22760, partial [Bacillus haynesii]|uniref:hypothetical protein n=1 Tax=Bacillus haynesii TaxID=1925021 RepID=UPI00227F1AE3
RSGTRQRKLQGMSQICGRGQEKTAGDRAGIRKNGARQTQSTHRGQENQAAQAAGMSQACGRGQEKSSIAWLPNKLML